MSTWTDLDLTDVVEQVAATVWGQQKPGLAWSDLTPVEQHSCREAALPFVVATRDALDVAARVAAARAEALREAADEYRQPALKVGTAPDMVRHWLRERAAREAEGVDGYCTCDRGAGLYRDCGIRAHRERGDR